MPMPQQPAPAAPSSGEGNFFSNLLALPGAALSGAVAEWKYLPQRLQAELQAKLAEQHHAEAVMEAINSIQDPEERKIALLNPAEWAKSNATNLEAATIPQGDMRAYRGGSQNAAHGGYDVTAPRFGLSDGTPYTQTPTGINVTGQRLPGTISNSDGGLIDNHLGPVGTVSKSVIDPQTGDVSEFTPTINFRPPQMPQLGQTAPPAGPMGASASPAPAFAPPPPPIPQAAAGGQNNPPAPPAPPGLDEVIRTVWAEGDPNPAGWQAVAGVIANRARQSGRGLSDVVAQRHQFEGYGNRRYQSLQPGSPQYQAVAAAIAPVLSGQTDPTNGADSFYSPGLQAKLGRSAPSWDDGTGQMIGSQRFFQGKYGGARAMGNRVPMPQVGGGQAPGPMAGSQFTPGGGVGAGVQIQGGTPPASSDAIGSMTTAPDGSVHIQGGVHQLTHGTNPDDAPLKDNTIDYVAQQYMLTGQLPAMGMGRAAAANRDRILNRAAEIEQETGATGADAVERHMTVRTATAALTTVSRQRAVIGPAEHTANLNADQVLALAPTGGGPSGAPILNRWIQAGRQSVLGDPDVSRFNLAVGTLADEYAKVVSGGTGAQAATDSARAEAYRRINGAMNLQQLRGVVAQMRVEMQNRMSSLADEEQRQRAVIHGGGRASPPDASAGSAGTAPANAVPPPAQRRVGQTYQTPSGPHVWTGAGWQAP